MYRGLVDLALMALGWTATASVTSFALYAIDKRRAVRNRDGARRRRVPERTLHLIDLIGGWPGGLLARRAFRHKTDARAKARFVWTSRAIVAVHLALWAVVAYLLLRS
jgi:uncharacterized membrane protein YsdA (DUF1294 family)